MRHNSYVGQSSNTVLTINNTMLVSFDKKKNDRNNTLYYIIYIYNSKQFRPATKGTTNQDLKGRLPSLILQPINSLFRIVSVENSGYTVAIRCHSSKVIMLTGHFRTHSYHMGLQRTQVAVPHKGMKDSQNICRFFMSENSQNIILVGIKKNYFHTFRVRFGVARSK